VVAAARAGVVRVAAVAGTGVDRVAAATTAVAAGRTAGLAGTRAAVHLSPMGSDGQ
jgi:hypothetical protein